MLNHLILFVYLFLIVLVASCSDNKKSETQIVYEDHMSKFMCANSDQLTCWEVSKNSCEEGFKKAVSHCITFESKFVLDQREKGREVIDPVCLTNKFIENIEVDEDIAEKCDKYAYRKEDARKLYEEWINN